MKKRSLVSAVAMLVVSAIMLTSATYAWFSTGGPAKIGPLKGMTAQAGAGVFVKPVNTGDWSNRLGYTDLVADTANFFVTKWVDGSGNPANPDVATDHVAPTLANYHPDGTYHPVSADPSTFINTSVTPNAMKSAEAINDLFYCYQLNNSEFKAYTPGTNDPEVKTFYDCYEFLVGAAAEDTTAAGATTTDTNIDVRLEITGNAAKAARVAVFACPNYLSSDAAWSYVGTFTGSVDSGEEWYPIVGALASGAKDADADYIVGTGDNDSSASPAVDITTGKITSSTVAVTAAPVATAGSTKSFRLTDVHIKGGYNYKDTNNNTVNLYNTKIRAYVWLEGQDVNCTPFENVDGEDIQVTWKFIANPLNDAGTGDSIADGAQPWTSIT